MEDIYQWCRDGNSLQVRVWLDETSHDMNAGYINFLNYNFNFNFHNISLF